MSSIVLDIVNHVIMMLLLVLLGLLVERIRPIQTFSNRVVREKLIDIGFSFITMLIAPLFQLVVLSVLIAVLGAWVPQYPLSDHVTSLPEWAQVFYALLVMDFAVYWRHRFTHKYTWAIHSVHHAAKDMNMLTKFRLHPADIFIATLFTTVILYFLGFGGGTIIIASFVLMGMDLLAHINIRLPWPKPFKYIFGGPMYHRWHHALDEDAHDTNFAIVFAFWDILFGTYYLPDDKEPRGYGLADSNGKRFYPEGFIQQLIYPFKSQKKL